MNSGDWIQLLLIIIVFFLLAAVIYSLIILPWWIPLLEIFVLCGIFLFLRKRIR